MLWRQAQLGKATEKATDGGGDEVVAAVEEVE
jgi:hypothetical protein